jgi:hypothetical protein
VVREEKNTIEISCGINEQKDKVGCEKDQALKVESIFSVSL